MPTEIEEKTELEKPFPSYNDENYERAGEEKKIKEQFNPFLDTRIARDYDEFVVMCYDVCSPKNPITKGKCLCVCSISCKQYLFTISFTAMIVDAKNGTLSEDRNFKVSYYRADTER